jgi:glycosyltransferase involved in cell wall biosynthesis
MLHFAGKGDRQVAAVFGFTPSACHQLVGYLSRQQPEIPIWLFSTAQPASETAALCEQVEIRRNGAALLCHAERTLWPCRVVLCAGAWTGERGNWAMKLAPFLIPPFRAVVLNPNGDFFSGTTAKIPFLIRHSRPYRRMKDLGMRIGDLGRAYWLLVSYHIWRSGPWTRVKHVCASVCLWLAATVLRWCCYPDRVLFKRLHGSEPLPLPSAPVGDAGVARFGYKGLNWNGPEFEKFVRTNNVRWILWQEEGAESTIDDMLPLFQDERTFAVSRQSLYRAWHPSLLPMAPFRTLQPGEASRVQAPVSETILLDRQKLLALGIPHCGLSGTAWLLMFWKAAAAGWRSFSVGQSGPLSPQPDIPMQERAFIFQALLNPLVRRLAPREPDLDRGNIAFPLNRQERRARLKVLIVSPFLPYPLSHGGAVRIYNLCRALADRVDFILAVMLEKEDVVHYDKLHEVFREVYVLDKDERASGDMRLPQQVREHQSRSLRVLMADLKPDLIQIEYTHMAAFRDSVPETPAVLVEHDLTFGLYRQLAENKPGKTARREYERWLAFEQKWLRAYDAVWTVSEEERQAAIREGSRPERTFTVPNGVDIGRFVPCDAPTSAPAIFYVGSFRHLPNVLAFEKLCEEVMPWVWNSFPNARLRVVAGPEYERFRDDFGRKGLLGGLDKRIEIHGFVEDLRPLYAEASVVVAPLVVSSGTNIKVLEAMACGKAIVSTPIGCAGLGLCDGYDVFLREDWREFAQTVCGLLSDESLRSQVGGNARRTAEERFGWDAIGRQAFLSYLSVLGRGELECQGPVTK